jgi:hypothetical protein
MVAKTLKRYWPVLVAVLVSVSYSCWRLGQYGWDAARLAEIGTRFSDLEPGGSEGYDGQFAYFIALDPDPGSVRDHLDVPAYRYQRILLPIISRLLSFAQPVAIPWVMLVLNLGALGVGTGCLAWLLSKRQLSSRYSLIYGLWVGMVASVGLLLNEPLAYGLVAAGWVARERGRRVTGAVLLTLAMFAKETTLLFWFAVAISELCRKAKLRDLAPLYGGGLAFTVWQIWLWMTFGTPGFGSGGAMATPFEWIPFNGLFRIAQSGWQVFLFFLVVFTPTVVLPSIWGVIASVRELRSRLCSPEGWALLANSAIIATLPFSTFREPLGLLRFFTGFILAMLLLAIRREWNRPLNYGLFWIALTVILLKS